VELPQHLNLEVVAMHSNHVSIITTLPSSCDFPCHHFLLNLRHFVLITNCFILLKIIVLFLLVINQVLQGNLEVIGHTLIIAPSTIYYNEKIDIIIIWNDN